MRFGSFGFRAVRRHAGVLALLVLLLPSATAQAQQEGTWVGTWATAPVLLPPPTDGSSGVPGLVQCALRIRPRGRSSTPALAARPCGWR